MPFLDNHPAIKRVGQFFLSYARKATVQGGVGSAITTALLSALPTTSQDGLLNWLSSLPLYVSVPCFFAIFFLTTYYPPNGPRPGGNQG